MSKIKRYLHRHAKNIPVIFGCIVLLFGVGFILHYKKVFKTMVPNQAAESLPQVSVTVDYLVEAKAAMTDFELFLQGKKTGAELTQRRDQLLSLTITKDYQSLHLSLVMIADALIATDEGNQGEKERALELLEKVLQEHPELKS